MRTKSGRLLAILATALGGSAMAQDMSKVSNTPHNMTTVDVWGVVIPQNRVCLPCHTPHNAHLDDDGESLALWSHATTEQTFEMYTTQAGHQGGQPDKQDHCQCSTGGAAVS